MNGDGSAHDGSAHDAAALHDAALRAALRQVRAVPDGAWDDPTPCTDWPVRAVVGHLAWGNLVLAAALGGAPFTEPAGGRTVPLAEPVPAAYAATVVAVRARLAVARPATVAFPTGPVPLADALRIRVQDIVVHCWDLAVATGRPLDVPAGLVAAAEETARARVLPAAQFAPPVPVPGPASPLARLVALTGRDPDGMITVDGALRSRRGPLRASRGDRDPP